VQALFGAAPAGTGAGQQVIHAADGLELGSHGRVRRV
jgi:hypothetical protein